MKSLNRKLSRFELWLIDHDVVDNAFWLTLLGLLVGAAWVSLFNVEG